MELYHIEHHKSSPYRPQINGAIEATNKNILSKIMVTYKDWTEKTPILPMGIQNFYSGIDWGSPLPFGLWKRGDPSHRVRDTIFKGASGNQGPGGRLDERKI